MAGKIYLVGTLHWDLNGEERVYTALEKLNPNIVTVEYVPTLDGVDVNEIANTAANKIMEKLKSCKNFNFAEDDIAQFARLTRAIINNEGYESRAVKRFADDAHIPFHVTRNHEDWEIAADNYYWEDTEKMILKIGSMARLKKYINKQYEITRIAYDAGINPEDEEKCVSSSLTGRRDLSMSSDIRRLSEQNPDNVLVNTGGAFHFYDSPGGNTVYSQLDDLSPERMLINEFEPAEVKTA